MAQISANCWRNLAKVARVGPSFVQLGPSSARIWPNLGDRGRSWATCWPTSANMGCFGPTSARLLARNRRQLLVGVGQTLSFSPEPIPMSAKIGAHSAKIGRLRPKLFQNVGRARPTLVAFGRVRPDLGPASAKIGRFRLQLGSKVGKASVTVGRCWSVNFGHKRPKVGRGLGQMSMRKSYSFNRS